ncbi:uncharacterized protein LOC109723184 [Ananas comosus]|uniref:Uncharacterized protein LOC109723184 n=1 Tax=Ananas comosus TaxID=4615 RepID=A0A6P5GEM2_ANACO|nr:uncharacterized protein LOC109723184 [Ananas comosus]
MSPADTIAGGKPPPPPSEVWKERIIVPTVLAGIIGGGYGLLSKHRKAMGPASAATTYAANLAVIAVCYSGARELARDARASEPGDFMNSVVGGFASGALLGRVQGGQLGAVRYAIIFAAAGTAVDFAAMQISPYLQSFRGSLAGDKSWWKLPEWSPIQVLDEEALAAKRAREQQLYAQRTFGKMNKEDC